MARKKQVLETGLKGTIERFLIAKEQEGITPGTLRLYHHVAAKFKEAMEAEGITEAGEIDQHVLRRYMINLSQSHNEGGVHLYFRMIRTFLLWYEREENVDRDWRNPIKMIKAPKVAVVPIDGVPLETVSALLKTCKKGSLDDRDRALLLFLLDTGARAEEAMRVNRGDIDANTGQVLIRMGKGRKPRTVFMGKRTRTAVRQYLRHRADDEEALWITSTGKRLTYWGVRDMLVRRSEEAGVDTPPIHSFRRRFALEALRNGMDLISLQRIMGHADLQVMHRYLAQTTGDLQIAHTRASPADNL